MLTTSVPRSPRVAIAPRFTPNASRGSGFNPVAAVLDRERQHDVRQREHVVRIREVERAEPLRRRARDA